MPTPIRVSLVLISSSASSISRRTIDRARPTNSLLARPTPFVFKRGISGTLPDIPTGKHGAQATSGGRVLPQSTESSCANCSPVRARCTSPSRISPTCSEGTYVGLASAPVETAIPSKMSRSASPSISCTVPTSSPSAATIFHPGSTTNHDTGSGTCSHHLAADVPDRALRRDRPRVGEGAQDAHHGRDASFVLPLEAALDHLRGGAVPESPRAMETEARRRTVAGRVERREGERGRVEMVARGQLDLAVEIAPVGGQGRQRRFPGCCRRAELEARGRGRLGGADEP